MSQKDFQLRPQLNTNNSLHPNSLKNTEKLVLLIQWTKTLNNNKAARTRRHVRCSSASRITQQGKEKINKKNLSVSCSHRDAVLPESPEPFARQQSGSGHHRDTWGSHELRTNTRRWGIAPQKVRPQNHRAVSLSPRTSWGKLRDNQQLRDFLKTPMPVSRDLQTLQFWSCTSDLYNCLCQRLVQLDPPTCKKPISCFLF